MRWKNAYKFQNTTWFVEMFSESSNYYYFVSLLPEILHWLRTTNFNMVFKGLPTSLTPFPAYHLESNRTCFLSLENTTIGQLFSAWCIFSPAYLFSCSEDVCCFSTFIFYVAEVQTDHRHCTGILPHACSATSFFFLCRSLLLVHCACIWVKPVSPRSLWALWRRESHSFVHSSLFPRVWLGIQHQPDDGWFYRMSGGALTFQTWAIPYILLTFCLIFQNCFHSINWDNYNPGSHP